MNILKRIRYHRFDGTYIGHKIRPGWRGSLPFYRFFCPKHGVVENYPQGYAEVLRCPKCVEEHLQRQRTIDETKLRTIKEEKQDGNEV